MSTAPSPTLSLPDYLLAGGNESDWVRAQPRANLPTIIADGEIQLDAEEDGGADVDGDAEEPQEIVMEQPPENGEEESESGSDSSDNSDNEKEEMKDADDNKKSQNNKPILSRPSDPTSNATSSTLLDDDDLLQPSTLLTTEDSPHPDLVEYEIVIDGVVQGSTFLPRRSTDEETNAEYQDRALQVKADAIKKERKRKWQQRMGYEEMLDVTSTAAASAAAAASSSDSGFIPLPPALCSSCQLLPMKYKCPRCDTGSCSLACVTQHKLTTKCSGVRSRSSYIPLARMDERTLQNDVAFLTDAERLSDTSKRDPMMKDRNGQTIVVPMIQQQEEKREEEDDASAPRTSSTPSTTSLFSCTPRHLSSASYTLMSACTQHRQIKLMCLPLGMKMQKENASKVFERKKTEGTTTATTKPTPYHNAKSSKHHHKPSSTPHISLAPSDSFIRWTVHLIFKSHALTSAGPESDLKIVKLVDERCTWIQVLDSVMKAEESSLHLTLEEKREHRKKMKEMKLQDIPIVQNQSTAILRHQLEKFYPEKEATAESTAMIDETSSGSDSTTQNAPSAASSLSPTPYSHLRLLYPVPFQPSNCPQYYSLSLTSTILTSLAWKVLIEHPVIWIVLAKDLMKYTIVEEPKAPRKEVKDGGVGGGKKKEKGEWEVRKKKRKEMERKEQEERKNDGASTTTAAAVAASSTVNTTAALPTSSTPSTQSHSRNDSYNNQHRGRGGFHNNNRGGNSHRGGGAGGHRGGGYQRGGGRGGGRGGNHQYQPPPPAFSFGVSTPAPVETPAGSKPSLFKKWKN